MHGAKQSELGAQVIATAGQRFLFFLRIGFQTSICIRENDRHEVEWTPVVDLSVPAGMLAK